MMPAMILRGDVLTIESVSGAALVARARTGQVYRLRAEPTGGRHVDHREPRPGDRLVVERDSAPNGDTLVTAPCGCAILLLAEPAP
jgi:hypothetical protein